MASETQTRILDIQVNYSKAIKGISEYEKKLAATKEQEKLLKDEWKKGAITQEEYRKELAAIKVAQTEYRSGIRTLNKEIQNNIKIEKEQEGSIISLRAELSVLNAEYDKLSRTDRVGDAGAKKLAEIQNITKELKAAEEESGRFYRNVGNYEEAIQNAIAANVPFIGQLQTITQQSGGLNNVVRTIGNSLKVLAANPFFLILAGLSAVILMITKAINSSEEASNRWKTALAPLNRLLQGLLNIIQKLGGALLSVIEGAGKAFSWISKQLERLPLVGKYFKKINDETKKSIELQKERISIDKQERQNQVDNAKDALAVAELRKTAQDKENATARERLDALIEANKIEEQIAKRNLDLAERRFELLKTESEWAQNDKKANEELAKLEAELYNARKEYNEKTRTLLREENRVRKEIETERKQILQNEANAVKAYEDLVLSMRQDGVEKEITLLENQTKRKIAELQQQLKDDKNLTKAAREAINNTILALEEKLQQDIHGVRDKASKEALQKEISIKQQEIAIRLELSAKESKDELDLRLEQLEQQRKIEIANAEETGLSVELINRKFNKAVADERKRFGDQASARRKVEAQKVLSELDAQAKNAILKLGQDQQAILDTEIANAEERYNYLVNLSQEEKEALYTSQIEYENAILESNARIRQAEEESARYSIESAQTQLQAFASISDSMSGLFESFADDNEAWAGFSKAMGLFTIGLNSAIGVAEAVKAGAGQPFPANLAAIAAGITAVLSAIAQAKKLMSDVKEPSAPKFHTGGYVEGGGEVPAILRAGESVMAPMPTSMFTPILSSLNQLGGGSPINATQSSNQAMGENMLARAFAKGMASLPNPQVAVTEIDRVSGRVNVIEYSGNG